MSKPVEKTSVRGGWIKRETRTGRFVEVATENGLSKATEKTSAKIKEVSGRRHAALMRLKDR
ncbi:hypothetical protein [uncultured Salipiger sp.]|uniref:hypothetical protein n=1 Tax=uncultured Salipiger sp. TaxID=499810 RepID=UPI0025949CE5|nr:hypothetical protein [uncultured Salipiger sp.]